VNTWNNNNLTLKRNNISKTSNRPIDVSHVKSTINTWNDEYHQSLPRKQQTTPVKNLFFEKFSINLFF
jgi:hypothetical protein